MVLIHIPYIILEKGNTKNLMKDREHLNEIFGDIDEESLLEAIDKYDYYYKVKYPNYPKIALDVDRLCEWAHQNKYMSLATDEEKKKN